MINPVNKFIACFAAAAIAAPAVANCAKEDPWACLSSRLPPVHLMFGTATNAASAALTVQVRDATAGIDRAGPSPLAFQISKRAICDR
jgi:Na+/H+-dicarboxylate symporter